ncbi:hypothetical protein EOL73_01720 [Candidatus Saccharibacteria bacterium]|nr:hypothetical protein [Candidatus Saccharibacteria bacterium]NCU40455.1 hypothetical protein [Candidatus Saccharibacteria bacterium]
MDRFNPRANISRDRPAVQGRDTNTNPGPSESVTPSYHATQTAKQPIRSRQNTVVIGLIIFSFILIVGVLFWPKSGLGGSINSRYQAVFLSNGSVYFGKLQTINDSYLKITNVYFIEDKTSVDASTATNDNKINLIKLDASVHGPKDEMIINRDQVLFFENLKEGGAADKLLEEEKNKS